MASILFVAFMLCLFLYTWKEARRFRQEDGIRKSKHKSKSKSE